MLCEVVPVGALNYFPCFDGEFCGVMNRTAFVERRGFLTHFSWFQSGRAALATNLAVIYRFLASSGI